MSVNADLGISVSGSRLFSRRFAVGLAVLVGVFAGLVVSAACLAFAAPAQARPFAYVTNILDDTVSQYDAAGGSLSPLSPATVPAGNRPQAVAVTPDGHSVYVLNQGSATLSQYDVGAGGALTPKTPPTVPAGRLFPTALAVSPDGKSVYVADFGDGAILQYNIGAGGTLTLKTPATAPSGAPTSLAVSPDGKSVYATNDPSPPPGCPRGQECPSTVSQYDVGPDGVLTPKTPSTVQAGIQPAAVAVSPDGKSVYVANSETPNGANGSISEYNVGAGGTLTARIPAAAATGVFPEAVVISPDGSSVYVLNEFESASNLSNGAVFQYDRALDGAITPKTPAFVATGSSLGGLAISPDAKVVYAVNGGFNTGAGHGSVSQYNVGNGGVLTPKSPLTVPAGGFPEGIAVTPLPRVPTSKAQCTNGGWRNFPQFKNQGQCVAFVVTQARQKCLAERATLGLWAFRNKYGLGRYHVRAMRRCVNRASR
jgi:DNA-binding beta-propeller fold protein YncE